MDNTFILTPSFLDQPLPGLKSLARPGWTINEPDLPPGDQTARIAAINVGLARVVARTVAAGRRPVSLAGDCLSAIGVAAGLQAGGLDPVLVWFDAHGDFNTPETTPSGFLGGMPLAMIAGRGDQTIVRAAGLRTWDERRIVLTDARDLDPGERTSLRNSSVTVLADPGRLAEVALPDGPLYVHLDTDVITPEEAPAQNYPAPGGLSVAELEIVLRGLAGRAPVAAVSLSSWNPDLGQAKLSEASSLRLLEALIS
jgi:arginase